MTDDLATVEPAAEEPRPPAVELQSGVPPLTNTEDALDQAIRSFVKAGARNLKGARIFEHKYAVTR